MPSPDNKGNEHDDTAAASKEEPTPRSRRSVAFAVGEPPVLEKDDDFSSRTGTSAFQAHVAKLSAQRQQHQQYSLKRSGQQGQPQPIITADGTQQQPQQSHLNHMQYHWPGTTSGGGGGQHHLDVRPMLYHELLASNTQIVIPLFQRRYCWSTVQIQQWYHDVVSPVAGQHRTHKTMFKRTSPSNVLLCIDGQQRMTTTTLFLAALRGICRKNQYLTLVDKIDYILFQGTDSKHALQQWAMEQALEILQQKQQHHGLEYLTGRTSLTMTALPAGWLPANFQTTLVPSYVDRAAYFEILFKDYVEESLEKLLLQEQEKINASAGDGVSTSLGFSSPCRVSIQYTAFSIFSQQIAKAVAALEAQNSTITTNINNKSTSIASFLSRLFRKQLYGFSFMYIELLTDDNLQQVFLWMQEKSVFGMGRLLFNPHPGVDFTPMDLARNLVVRSVMNEPLSDQVDFYTQCWLTPLEERFGNTTNNSGQLGRILNHLVERVTQRYESTITTNHQGRRDDDDDDDDDTANDGDGTQRTRYIGDLEQQLDHYKAMVPPALQKSFQKDAPMMVYGRFHSYVQQRAIEMEGEPCAITRGVADSIVQELVREGESMGL